MLIVQEGESNKKLWSKTTVNLTWFVVWLDVYKDSNSTKEMYIK